MGKCCLITEGGKSGEATLGSFDRYSPLLVLS